MLQFPFRLPRFSEIAPQQIAPTLDALLMQAQDAVVSVIQSDQPVIWQNVCQALEIGVAPLSMTWSLIEHLAAVKDTPQWRSAHKKYLPIVSAFFVSLEQNTALYEKIKQIVANQEAYASLSATRKRILERTLLDFRLGGAELSLEEKSKFAAVQAQLTHLSKEFADHVLDATDHYAYWVEQEQELAGLPEAICTIARQKAQEAVGDKRKAWKFTLHQATYLTVMNCAQYRGLRKALYTAYVTRASECAAHERYVQDSLLCAAISDQESGIECEKSADDAHRIRKAKCISWDNTENIQQQRALRLQKAQLLGLKDYSALSLCTKMAESSAQITEFLEGLAERARPFAQKEWAELSEFAQTELHLAQVEPWDFAYVSEQLRARRYHFSESEIKQYFPLDCVLKGLFKLAATLFGITIVPAVADVWHPDVLFFEIKDENQQLIGQFYGDFYAREGKLSGAWMDEACVHKRLIDGSIQTPVAYLVCNFQSPVIENQEKQAALLTHDEVITLFHEFGHGLHHLLSKVEEEDASGLHGIERDAIEFPSQLMENFCWEWSVLSDISAHQKTGAMLPRELYDKMLASRHFQAGLALLRQIVFSLFDLAVHQTTTVPALTLAREIHQKIQVYPQAECSRWPNTFMHIFAGGYAVGYYGYLWAEVLACDAYTVFEDAAKTTGNLLDPIIGKRYLKEILAVGGSRSALDSFKAFRGRLPNYDALLRHRGLVAA